MSVIAFSPSIAPAHIPASIPEHITSVLEVNLGTIKANYQALQRRFRNTQAGAVVKADCYGLGHEAIVQALSQAGCRHFFCADLNEGLKLRKILKDHTFHHIYVLGGLRIGAEAEYVSKHLIPALSDLEQVLHWSKWAKSTNSTLPAVLYLNTGLNRTGLSLKQVEYLGEHPEICQGFKLHFIMTHLACSKILNHPFNEEQLRTFHKMLPYLPEAPLSIGDSGTLIMDERYHANLIRFGGSIYGITPPGTPEDTVQSAFNLKAKILQVWEVEAQETVGYGCLYTFNRPGRIATIGIGYADGYPRCLTNRGEMSIAGQRVPIAGRISMDYISLDVTDINPELCKVGNWVEVLGSSISVQEIARAADTIAYEITTGLGSRYYRSYIE